MVRSASSRGVNLARGTSLSERLIQYLQLYMQQFVIRTLAARCICRPKQRYGICRRQRNFRYRRHSCLCGQRRWRCRQRHILPNPTISEAYPLYPRCILLSAHLFLHLIIAQTFRFVNNFQNICTVKIHVIYGKSRSPKRKRLKIL